MLTIYGVPLSVHTRKVIVTAIIKGLDYKLEVVVPVIPDNPPPNWETLSPTGLIPVLQDGDYTLADSSAICQYLERKHPVPPVLPRSVEDLGRALWFDAYAGGTVFRNIVHPLFHQKIVGPNIRKVPTDYDVVDDVLRRAQPKAFRYLESQLDGRFLAGDALTLADIAIVSNLIVYQYLGFPIDAGDYPRLARYVRDMLALDAFKRALAVERPFIEQMGLDRRFLA